jgi:hypothetical protein
VFVKFAREHWKRKLVIVCPCKKCLLGKSWSSEVVFAHLMSSACIIEGYIKWIMHGELLVPPADNEAISEALRMVQMDSIPLHGGSSAIQDMLNDVFAMHDVCVEAGGSQVRVEVEAESVDAEIEYSNRGANKLEEFQSVEVQDKPWLQHIYSHSRVEEHRTGCTRNGTYNTKTFMARTYCSKIISL